MKRYLSKRVWSVVLAAAGLFTAPLCAPLQAQEAQIFIGDSHDAVFQGKLIECIISSFANEANAVIKLQCDVDINDGTFLSVNNGTPEKPVVIDLNGKTLTCDYGWVIQVDQGYGLTIRDSGSGGAIVNTQSGGGAGIYNHGGAVTIEGGRIYGKDCAIYNPKGTLTVTGGTLSGDGSAVDNGATVVINGGTLSSEGSAVSNVGTATINGGTLSGKGCAVFNDGTATSNGGKLTVGSNVSIKSDSNVGINSSGTLTVTGYPTFDAGNSCDIRLFQFKDGTNSVITFDKDITTAPVNRIKVSCVDAISGDPVTLGDDGLVFTAGYAEHVKYPTGDENAGKPIDPGDVFQYVGNGGNPGVGLKGGEAVAFADGSPVAKLTMADGFTRIYYKGSGNGEYATAADALQNLMAGANEVLYDVTVTLMQDVDLGNGNLAFTNKHNVAGSDPARLVKMTLDLGGCQLSGSSYLIVNNSAASLTVTDTRTGGAIVPYGICSSTIDNKGGLTVKDVTIHAVSSGGSGIRNAGELTVKDVTLYVTGLGGSGIHNYKDVTDGTLTIDGAPTFNTSSGAVDIFFESFVPIGIGDNFGLTDNHKITIGAGDDDHFFQLTSGYGERMRYPAGNAKAGKVIPPSEYFALPANRTDSLAFAGGEVWVAPSGTLALVETPTKTPAYEACTTVKRLAEAVSDLDVDATVTLTADVAMKSKNLTFQARDKHFTLDLSGHEISSSFSRTIHVKDGALLDIIDSDGGGCITNTLGGGISILNSSVVSIPGGVTIKSTGSESSCIFSTGGTTTFKGWPTFELGARTICVRLNQNDVITFTDDISAVPAQKISVSYSQDKFGKLTSGYGAHVRYLAGHDKQGEPIDPDEVFTYKRYGTLVASVHPKLVGTGDAAEAELWMPTMAVAYIDENGVFHNDLDHPGGTGDDDAALAYILDGTETTLGKAGDETWYVAQGTLNYEALAGSNDPALKTDGDVHIILADGAAMTANSNKYGIYAYKDDNQSEHNGHLYIHSQGGRIGTAEGKLTVSVTQPQSSTSIAYGIISERDITITGGDISVTATNKGDQTSHGLGSVGNLTISGGKLNIIATTEHDYQCDGIHANGTLNIGNAEVTASATCKGSEKSYGIYAESGLTFDKGKVTATATCKGSEKSYGIYAESGLTFDKGKVTASGVTEGSGMSYGIYATDAITSTSAEVTATATCKGSEKSYGIYANTTLSIDKGKLEATGVTEGSGPGFGIWANGAITSTSAEVTASGYCIGSNDSYGIYAENTLSIDKGTVTATGKTTGSASSCGILAQGATTFYDAVVKAEAETDGDGSSTGICNSDILTVTKGNVTATALTKNDKPSRGIDINKDINFNDAVVTASANSEGGGATRGIRTEVGNLTINKGNVTAIGKTTGSASSYGINIGEASSGNLSITGGTLTANGQNDDNNKTAGIKASTITLDWSDASDEIMASSYDGTVTIPAGRYFAALKDDGTVGQIYGKAATDGDYTFSASDIYAIAGKTLHPVAIIPSSGEEYIGYSEQEGDMAIIGGTAKTYAVVGYDLSASPAVVYVAEVSGLPKGSAVVLGPATDGGTLPNEVAVVVQSGSAATGIESSFTNAKPLANFIAAPADGTTPLDKQIAQAFSTSTPSDYLAFMLTGGQFRAVTRTATTVLPANTAVLVINKMDVLRGGSLGNKPANARRITLGTADGDMTGIKSIENGALGQRPLATEGTQEWYSIDGRKMNQAPKAKGIYIHNGTKYVVR